MWRKRQFLVDDNNTTGDRIARRSKYYFSPFDNESAGVRLMDAAEDFDKGGFSRSIFTNYGVHLTCGDRKIDAIKNYISTKGLSQSLGLKDNSFGFNSHNIFLISKQRGACTNHFGPAGTLILFLTWIHRGLEVAPATANPLIGILSYHCG